MFVTPNFCVGIVFSFSWGNFNSQEKLKTMLMQILRGNKQRTLWYVIVFSGEVNCQARNQDFMWGGANEAKVDQTTEMYFLLSDPFI